MDPIISRQNYRTPEPFHAIIYFVPEARSAYERIGLEGRPMGYFAARGAPRGEVSGERRTDQLALPPWEQLGEAACKRLRELVPPLQQSDHRIWRLSGLAIALG